MTCRTVTCLADGHALKHSTSAYHGSQRRAWAASCMPSSSLVVCGGWRVAWHSLRVVWLTDVTPHVYFTLCPRHDSRRVASAGAQNTRIIRRSAPPKKYGPCSICQPRIFQLLSRARIAPFGSARRCTRLLAPSPKRRSAPLARICAHASRLHRIASPWSAAEPGRTNNEREPAASLHS